MKYENHTIPEGINVSKEHPLKEFSILLIGLSIVVTILVASLSFAAGWMVQFIPFEAEVKLANSSILDDLINLPPPLKDKNKPTTAEDTETAEQQQAIENYLQQLANKLAKAQQLPKGMYVTVHYSNSSMVNAFATLGGHIFMYKGLIEKLPDENSLAMVMAHEIAHIKHRDPMIAAGRGITVALALISLVGIGDGMAQQLLGQVGMITSLTFNREQEEEADGEALLTLQQHYGHTTGAEALFEVLQAEHKDMQPPEFLSTHPITAERIAAVKQSQPVISATTQPLPEFLLEIYQSEKQQTKSVSCKKSPSQILKSDPLNSQTCNS